jgi:DNA (cytosine-5)-methyltransferase 1
VPFEDSGTSEFRLADVSDLSADDVASVFCNAELRLLAGCAPCQTFSTYSRGPKLAAPTDLRWTLLDHFGRLIERIQPEFVTMENVPRAAEFPAYRRFTALLERLGYVQRHEVFDCQLVGLPQARKRVVLLASRIGPIHWLERSDVRRTVRDAIGHLPPIGAGESSPHDNLHRASALQPLTLKRLRATPEGGDWRDWPEDLQLACHKRASGKTYRGVYGRMNWDAPAPTLTTLCGGVGNGRFAHPSQHRGISLREAALLQGFSSDYRFNGREEPLRPRTIARLIGNAVPPPLGKAIGIALGKSL